MTTPAQEAKKIFDRFYSEISEVLIINNVAERRVSKIAKQCALLHLDGIIEALSKLLSTGLNNDFDIMAHREEYLIIRQEIEKM